ncbi:MAG: GAF domain-containing protein, partial [Nodosilinea sp.]
MQHSPDRLFEAIAKATHALLTLENFDDAINATLNILGDGVGCDIIAILENVFESSSPLPSYCHFIYEWATPNFQSLATYFGSEPLPVQLLGEVFLEQYFLEGDGFGGLLEVWHEPLRSWLASMQVQSAYTVPIRVNGQWWGVLYFDYCRAPIQISLAELAVLGMIADCIGSAIQRERLYHAALRLKQERQQASQQRVADLEAYNQMLQGRDRLLEVTARATNVLLTLDNIDVAIDSALTVLIEGTGCDRIEILENVYDSLSPMPLLYRHTIQKCLDPQFEITRLDFEPAQAAELSEAFKKYFLEIDGFGGLLEEWDEPLRSLLATLQIQSTYAVPIRVNGQWWGILCFDYCRAPIQFSPAEVAVLRTMANCLGSAIQRERLRHAELRNQREREQIALQKAEDLETYNRVLQGRDRLFKATAKAANVLLTLENFDQAVKTALHFIGEGIGCDYVVVLENMFKSSSPLPSSCDFIYEWAAPGFLPLSVAFGSTSLPAELLGVDFMKQYFLEGDGFGGLVEVWNEPLRSALASVQVQSTYAVPIRVNGQWWGVLSLDYCRTPIQVSAAAISVLMAIADCIGSAIQRDRTQKIILQAEQTRVAELVKANTALKRSLDAFAADSDLDRFIGNTLTAIAQQFDAPLIEYWVHSQAGSAASIHLAYWQGQILSATNGSIANASSAGMVPFLDIPLSVGDTNIGALSIYLPGHRTFPREIVELAHALAQQLTLAVELTHLAEEAQQAALLQERTRMAREIHDTLAQAFGGILMQLQAFTYFAQPQPDQAQTHLLTAQALAKEGLAEARRSVWALHLETTEYENVDQAIAKFTEQTTSRQATPIHLAIEGTPYSLHPDLGLNLLRIAQEAIANALRHAHATNIQVHLSYSAQALQLTIRDDGCGFDPQSPTYGFGLLGMQQRAAHLGATWNLMSRPGQGTTIMVISHSDKGGLMRKPPEPQDYPGKRAGGEHPDETMSSKR